MSFPRVRCGWACLRRLGGWIFWLSLLGLLGSLGLAGWAYWLKERLGNHLNLALPSEGYLLPGTLGLAVLLVVPCQLLGIALWPSLVRDFARRRDFARSAGRSVNRLLLLHALLSCLSGWLAAGACAGGAYHWDQTRRRLGQGLRRAIRRYRDSETVKARLDRLQVELGCCGSESFVDWFFVPWVRSNDDGDGAGEDGGGGEDETSNEHGSGDYYFYLDERESIELPQSPRPLVHSSYPRPGEGDEGAGYVYLASVDVPFSCCLAQVLETCEHRNLFAGGANNLPMMTQTMSLSIATDGCRDKLLDRADEAGWEVFACLVLVALYQLAMSVLSRLLQTARLSAVNADARGRRFVGWIFGAEPRNETLLLLSSAESPPPPRTRSRRRLKSEKERLVARSADSRRQRQNDDDDEEDEDDEDDQEAGDDEDSDDDDDEEARYGRHRGGAAAAENENRKTHQQQQQQQQHHHNKRTTIAIDDRAATNYASSSSSSSLPPLPPTPHHRPSRRRVPASTQAALEPASCSLHGRCLVHAPLPRAVRPSCPVHGDTVDFRR